MKVVLETLVRLQGIDNELRRYQVQRDELTGKLGQLQDLVKRMEASLDEKRNKLGEVETWYKDQLESIRVDDDRISKLKASLSGVTKTKEYLLRQREIETLRKAKQSKEDELKKAQEAINDFRQTIKEEEARLDELRRETEEEGGSGWEQVRLIDERIKEIAVRKEDVIPELPKAIYRKYENIGKRRDGLAVVPVVNDSCAGCNVQIRTQLYNTLYRGETLETCPSCSRFIYIPAEDIDSEPSDLLEEAED